MSKPLISSTPYPSIDDISPDACALKIISPAYASSTGELNTILQYLYQSFILGVKGCNRLADKLESIAIAEMLHLKLLGKTIAALGALPVYTANPPSAFNFYSSKFVGYSHTMPNMIEDDIMAEKHAIYAYERMLPRLKNQKVRGVISRILEDERLHLAAFMDILKEVSVDK